MALGIIEPQFDGEITGTYEMFSGDGGGGGTVGGGNESAESSSMLKTTKKGIVLNPQPHDDPNDPLNWPIWKRDLSLLVLGWHCFVGGGQSSMLAAGMSSMSKEFNVSITTLSYLVGGFMLSLAFGAIFASPTAILFGKRVVYLFGIALFLGGCIWGAVAKSFGSLMGARVLMGIGISPIESLPSSTIAEIYFQHERAYRIGIYTLLLLGGKNLVPMFSAFIFQNLNRHWLYWICTIIAGINLILTIFFVPETYWNRAAVPPDKRSQEETLAARKAMKRKFNSEQIHYPNEYAIQFENNEIESINSATENQQPIGITMSGDDTNHMIDEENQLESTNSNANTSIKKPYKKELKVLSGRHSKDKWWMVFLRPVFLLVLYPHVLFGAFIYGFAVVWLIMISEVISEIFLNPPYNYSQLSVGLFYLSPFIGGSIGSLFAGRVSDVLIRFLVGKNNGIYEPELRLFMIIPSLVTTCIGLIGFGWASEVNTHWVAPIILFGVLAFGSSLSSTTSITFTVDSYKMFAAETLVAFNVVKNVIGFLFSLFNTSFNHKHGFKIGFVMFGCIQIFVSLWAIPLYIYGKKIRHWTDHKEFLRCLYNNN